MTGVTLLKCLGVLFGLVLSSAAKDVSPGFYKIHNVQDNLHLTIQGANASFAVVVGDNWQNFREQRWEVVKLGGSQGFHLIPDKYKSNNLLSYYKDATRKYPLPEYWNMLEVPPSNSGNYLMQNTRTKLCLTTSGRRNIVTETTCDKFRKSQYWVFTKL